MEAAAMTHRIRSREIDVPELDAFLSEYAAVCRKHGMQFSCEEYGHDGGCYTTIEVADDNPIPHLNLDYANQHVPCIGRAHQQANEEWRQISEQSRRCAAARAVVEERETYLRLKAKYEGTDG
jgi:hypothetical protein